VPREAGQEKTAARTTRLPRFFDQACDPVRVRKKDPELAFLTEVSSVPLRRQHQAFAAFFAGRGRR